MNTTDVMILLILAVILIAAIRYIYKSKKAGKRCVGCPDSGTSKCCCGAAKVEKHES